MNIATLAERNHALDERANSFAFGDGALDAILDNDRGDEVAEDGSAVRGVATEFVACVAMVLGVSSSGRVGVPWAGITLLVA